MSLNLSGNTITLTKIVANGSFNTRITRDGLICFLDPADVNSWDGSSTNLIDLSGNGATGVAQGSGGGVVFDRSINNGVAKMTSSLGGYITVNMGNLTSSNFTVMGAGKYTGLGSNARGRVFGGLNNWLMGWHNSSTESYYSEGWVTAPGSGANDNNWRIEAATGDINKDLYTLYVNGAPTTMNNSGGSAGPNQLVLGGYSAGGDLSDSYVGFLLVYNRVLNPYEICENFKAFKDRYGL